MKFYKLLPIVALLFILQPVAASAGTTEARQIQLNGGLGVFVGTEGLGASFDFSLEPEFFITTHNSVSLRMDITAGDTDSFHVGSRWRYYFDITKNIDVFAGLGLGFVVNFNGGDFGDAALPVFGWQYAFGEHFKVGSDVSFNIIFNGNNAAFAARLMPAVVKWTF
jgi:hypothetical protein